MIDLDGEIVWSATDLTRAATCEYGFLREVDRVTGRTPPADRAEDPLLARAGEMGTAHEQAVLEGFVAECGEHDPHRGTGVARLDQAGSGSPGTLAVMAQTTRTTVEQGADVVYQAGFFDGEFHGYADFLRRTDAGWVVADTKIARRAKVEALLQVAAYADQLHTWGLPLAPHAELILGTGATQQFPLAGILPVFRERRERLRQLLRDHLASGDPASWSEGAYPACGSCEDCQEAIEQTRDVGLVAGLRMDQRRKFGDLGVRTVADLAATDQRPPGMAAGTFERLRAQAAMQAGRPVQAGQPGQTGLPARADEIRHEVFDPAPLLRLPEPSPGDLFFDFEGDPLYHEGASERWGLEYLWGVLRDPDAVGGSDSFGSASFEPVWADDRSEERAALGTFMERVAELRARHPDLHIYHYAPYEVTALKRLTAEHKAYEDELDDLLRHGVFVDLYAVVRSSVRISRPSYSLKELEPLYMGERHREGPVKGGDVSVVEYHHYRSLEPGSAEAEQVKRSLLDYNRYDCESTRELYRWLRGLVQDHPPAGPDVGEETAEQRGPEPDPELDRLREALLSRSGPAERAERTDEQQAWAMLESALGYYTREAKPFWWGHFDRLLHPVTEWADMRDVLVVESADVVADWHVEGKKLPRRTLALTGELGQGSTIEAGAEVFLLYDVPTPEGMRVPVHGLRGHGTPRTVTEIETVADGRVRMTVEEAVTKEQPTFDKLPVATTPHGVVHTQGLEQAIRELAADADQRGELPAHPGLDLLLRRPPRTPSGRLSDAGDQQAALVASLQQLDRSFLAVQGPPGTGKTRTGSRVITELVRDHGWRVGVVAQSHAVVEHMLDAVCEAGLEPERVGKRDKRSSGAWTGLKENKDLFAFCEERGDGGYVIGGTAWTFTGSGVPPGSLDLLVVDEAGQFALASTLAVSRAADRLLLLGDPQQLPQVSQGTHGEPVDDSALRWLMGEQATLPSGLGYFLGTTYRMHPAVCAPVSQLSYAGELHAAPVTSQRSLAGAEPGVQVVRLGHRGKSTSSVEEADEVVGQVGRLLGATWTDEHGEQRPLGESDVLVVTPYNAQRQLIRRRLADAGYGQVQVGTVDKFQGRQAPVVLMSMTASSRDEVPRGMGFVLNRNRINVAVSRAQWLTVIIRSRELTAYVPRTPADLLELGAFIGLCEGSPA